MELKTRLFHSSLLELAHKDPLPGQRNAPSPPIIVSNHEEWLVDDIVDSRWHYGKLQYRVRWVGHAELTWEPWHHIRDNLHLPGFHARYPRKPSPMPDNAQPPPDHDLDVLQFGPDQASQELSASEGGCCHDPRPYPCPPDDGGPDNGSTMP